MGWKDHLGGGPEHVTLPWVREVGRELRTSHQGWLIEGGLPPRPGWYRFTILVRKAFAPKPADSNPEVLEKVKPGYIVGDRFVPDDIRAVTEITGLHEFERIHLVEPGLDRFTRVAAGRPADDYPLIYAGMEMPQGAEDEVADAYLNKEKYVSNVPGVTPALDTAFRVESWVRHDQERRREEERKRREEEERRRRIQEQLGDGAGRRELAKVDFAEAATAALAIGGAEYLDHRESRNGEMAVKFRMLGRRFECICGKETLQIIDAGICLIDHRTEEKGDTFFTLESLPGVIQQAEREGKLVVFRHV